MPPEGQLRGQEPGREPLRVNVEGLRDDDSVDTAGDMIWPGKEEAKKKAAQREARLEAEYRTSAKEIVRTRIELGKDTQDYWNFLSEQLKELSKEVAMIREDAADEDNSNAKVQIANSAGQLQRVRFQLEALAEHMAKNRILSFLANEPNPSDVLKLVSESKDMHREIMQRADSHELRLNSAAAFIMRRAEQRIVNDLVENPDNLEALRSERKEFMDNILKKHSTVEGMSAEVSFTPKKKISRIEAALRDFDSQIKNVESRLQQMSWWQRTFSEEAKVLKKRLSGMQSERKDLAKKAAGEAVGRALRGAEALESKKFDYPEIPDEAVQEASGVELAWKNYQDALASLESLQSERAGLNRWPWKDRERKSQLAQEMKKQEYFVKKAKAEHGAQVRKASLERDQKMNPN